MRARLIVVIFCIGVLLITDLRLVRGAKKAEMCMHLYDINHFFTPLSANHFWTFMLINEQLFGLFD